MKRNKKLVEKQIDLAKKALDSRSSFLNSKKLTDKQIRNDSVYRRLEGKLRKINHRLRAIEAIEKCNQELASLRLERSNAVKNSKNV